MNKFTALYYKVTGFVPRRFPETQAELEHFKDVLLNAYGVIDHPSSWLTAFGHICSTEPVRASRSWSELATIVKRGKVNAFLSGERSKIMRALEEQLKTLAEAEVKASQDLEASITPDPAPNSPTA